MKKLTISVVGSMVGGQVGPCSSNSRVGQAELHSVKK